MHRLSLGLLALFAFTIPWGGIAGWMTIILLAIALICTLMKCILERKMRKPPALFYVLGVLVCWQLATYYWSIDPTATLERVQYLVLAFSLVWVITELCRSEGERLFVAQAFIVGCFVLCGIIIHAYLAGEANDMYRYVPTYVNANDGADLLAAGVALALLVIGSQPRNTALWTNIVFVPVAFSAVLLTASRGGFVITCLAAVGVFFVLRHVRVWARLAWVTILLAVLIGAFYGLTASQNLAPNLERITFQAETSSLDTLTGRTTIWSAAAEQFAGNPFFGVGAGTFPFSVSEALGRPRAAHNLFIEGAVETGLVGLILLIAAFAAVAVPVLRLRDRQTSLRLVVLAVMLGICMVGNFTAHYSLWFVLALLAMTGVGVEAAERTEEFSGDVRWEKGLAC
jgi:O-antigen ligase